MGIIDASVFPITRRIVELAFTPGEADIDDTGSLMAKSHSMVFTHKMR